ncbi:hypothetical protein TrVE_jg12072 [Triparma verrucosa]|uniref:Uncharacterized protein n=1 Tax=Triparma verrucosa TaxID=1606542 RepID=A0A9W7EWU7_9STRA|nr:hypothetical protein TrVE_jg12072 [Triparma verrucosa]
MSDRQVLKRIKDIRDGGDKINPDVGASSTSRAGPFEADDNQSVGSVNSAASVLSMSHSASDVFKLISPHLPPTEAPKVLRLISDAFANAQSRISAAEASRDAAQTRLRQSESYRKNEERIAQDKAKHHAESLQEARRQRDEAMEEVNKLHHTVQSMRVQATVANATSSLKDGGTGEDQGSRMSKSAAAMSSSMRTALEREFDEKKTLLEQRWDHALHLVTDQMKKQRDEQVALAVSKFDVEQRLKFQAEISKGLERVEAAARQEVGDLTKLALKMHATIESQNEKIAKLTDELNDVRRGSETIKKIEHSATAAAAEITAEKEIEFQKMRAKLAQSNVLIDELQHQVESWKAKSDGDWFRTRMTEGGHVKYMGGGGSKPTGVRKGITLMAEEENNRNRRKEAIEFTHSMSSNNKPSRLDQMTASNPSTDKIAAAIADDISLVSSNMGSVTEQRPFFRDTGGIGMVNTTQPSPVKELVGHPRLDALLSSF